MKYHFTTVHYVGAAITIAMIIVLIALWKEQRAAEKRFKEYRKNISKE